MGERSSSVISGRGARSFTSAAGLEKPRKCSPFLPPPAARIDGLAWSPRHQSARAPEWPPPLTLGGLSAPARCAAFSRVPSRPAGLSLQQRPEFRVRSCGGGGEGESHGECLVAGRPAGPVRPAAHCEPVCALGLVGQGSSECPATSHGSAEARPFLSPPWLCRTHVCDRRLGQGAGTRCTLRSPPALVGLQWMCPMLEKDYDPGSKSDTTPPLFELKKEI